MHTVFRQVLTAEQVQSMSVEEINAVIRKAMEYDEYRYQLENNILITDNNRAEGLQKVLYQCPHCLAESKMASKGTELFCTACGKPESPVDACGRIENNIIVIFGKRSENFCGCFGR